MDYKLTEEQVRQIKKDFSFINATNPTSRTTTDIPSRKILLAWSHPYPPETDIVNFVTLDIFEKMLKGIDVVDELEYLKSLGVSEFCLCVIAVPEYLFVWKGLLLHDNFFEWVEDSQFTFDAKKYGLS